jgi:alpha-tubulin suppressor-like RCC1 family protein
VVLHFVLAAALSLPPLVASGVEKIRERPAGSEHTCTVLVAGGVKCWGANASGQLGDGTNVNRNTPVDVSGLSEGVAVIAAGAEHTCALTGGGAMGCWGANFSGQLGDGTNVNRNTPVKVSGLSEGVTAIAAGSEHTCAVVAGGVKCWGPNSSGQLGDGTNVDRNTPVNVVGLSGDVTAIAAGAEHTCALTSGGAMRCWGANYSGQLGDGTNVNRNMPVNVSGLWWGVTEIAAGSEHTCAVVAGGVRCWGANFSGQLGDGTNVNRNTPVNVSGPSGDVVAIAPGSEHTCMLTTGGAMACWGANASGQLGIGTNEKKNTPANVPGLPSVRPSVRWRIV